jgi:aldose 1-epimerase
VRFTLTVRAQARMPVTIGWHPWFHGGRVRARPVEQYRRDSDGVPDGTRVPPTLGPWDDCFLLEEPPAVEISGRTISLSSDCSHWVIYDQRPDAVCVEPQSGPPDAPNLGLATILEAGASLTRWFRIGW